MEHHPSMWGRPAEVFLNEQENHTLLEHNGEQPEFNLKVIRFFRTPLAKQVAEEGGRGEILNSWGGTRCYIPR